jgi:hypothetical protein
MTSKEDLQGLAKAIAHTDWRSDAEKLEHLTVQWKYTKAVLKAAQEAHLQSEIDLYNAVKGELPNKGTYYAGDITIVTGHTEKWDQEKLNEIHHEWDGTLKFPFKGEWKADGKAISYIRDNVPGVYRTLSDALTLTEKKPAFSVKGEKSSGE